MPDDLYDRDALLWSEHQAALLHRLRRGEHPDEEPDWPNLIEEIESVGQSQLRACESLLRKAMEHLLKISAFPHGPVEHWRNETRTFLRDAGAAFTPSMAQRIDVPLLYRIASRDVAPMTLDGAAAPPAPLVCPFALTDLLPGADDALPDLGALSARLRSQPCASPG